MFYCQAQMVAQRDLRWVESRARKVAEANAALHDAIWKAHLSGESIRDIAPRAGLSVSKVYQLLREMREERGGQ